MDTDITLYHSWRKIPEGFFTKTQWNKIGSKLTKDAKPVARIQNCHGIYNLYDKDSTVPKKKIKLRADALELIPPNLIKCLYVVNKKAKRCRDAAEFYFDIGGHTKASYFKTLKYRHYDLKNASMDKLKQDNILKFVGYHKQSVTKYKKVRENHESDCDCYHCEEYYHGNGRFRGYDNISVPYQGSVYLACYEGCGFSFHEIVDTKILPEEADVKDLGKWRADSTELYLDIPLRVAVKTLKEYLSGGLATTALAENGGVQES